MFLEQGCLVQYDIKLSKTFLFIREYELEGTMPRYFDIGPGFYVMNSRK